MATCIDGRAHDTASGAHSEWCVKCFAVLRVYPNRITFAVPNARVKRIRSVVFERDADTCRYCKRPTSDDPGVPLAQRRTLDHVLPRDLGGQTTIENCVTACGQCNHDKGNMHPAETHKGRRVSWAAMLTAAS